MEPRVLLRSMTQKWWLFLIVFLVTMVAVVYMMMQQSPVYRTRATYLVRVSDEITDVKMTSTALDSLNRYAELQGTYSEIAMSQTIKRQAGRELGIAGTSTLRAMNVSSRTLPGSKILEITVEGENPELIRDFVEAVGDATATYVNDLYPAYRLMPLDPPSSPNNPISPKLNFNLMLGAILGAFLGLVAVLLSSWLRGDFKTAPVTRSDLDETVGPLPVKNELGLLLQQCEMIRYELNEAREVIRNTESQARAIRSMLNNLPNNGHSNGKEKIALTTEEQNETSDLENNSPTQ